MPPPPPPEDREKPTRRERDARKDRSAHRRDEPAPRGPAPRVATATAQYKRQLDALFDKGEIPAHLKDKLPAAETESGGPESQESKERVRLTRAVRQAPSGPELVRALDALREKVGGVPEDLDLVVRFFEHPRDDVLAEALTRLETAVELGLALPKASRKSVVTRLEGISLTSFDPRVQSRAAALAARLK